MIVCFCDKCGNKIKGLSETEWVNRWTLFSLCKKCKKELDKKINETKKEFFKGSKRKIKPFEEFKKEFEEEVLKGD